MARPSLLLVALLVACGGAPPAEERGGGDTLFVSAGGERPLPEPISTGPAPLPLPSPPIPRGALSPELQRYWTRAEEAIADAPPPAPADDDPNLEQWSTVDLRDWIQRRSTAMHALSADATELADGALYERAIAAALLGYLMEDTVADTRGAPVPLGIRNDPELLTVYRDALDDTLRPLAEQAAAGYRVCTESLDRHGDVAWGEWRAFCYERTVELAEVYGGTDPAAPEGEQP